MGIVNRADNKKLIVHSLSFLLTYAILSPSFLPTIFSHPSSIVISHARVQHSFLSLCVRLSISIALCNIGSLVSPAIPSYDSSGHWVDSFFVIRKERSHYLFFREDIRPRQIISILCSHRRRIWEHFLQTFRWYANVTGEAANIFHLSFWMNSMNSLLMKFIQLINMWSHFF